MKIIKQHCMYNRNIGRINIDEFNYLDYLEKNLVNGLIMANGYCAKLRERTLAICH